MASKSSTSPCVKRNNICNSNFQFEIDTSKLQNHTVGHRITSPKFTAGGYNWILEFYPQGAEWENKSHASVRLVLTSDAKDITAKFFLKLLSKTGNVVPVCQDAVHTFSRCDDPWDKPWRVEKCILKNKIKDFYCEKDSVVIISCDIRVSSEPKIVYYPGGLYEHIEKLWEKGEELDVTFEVEGENISAHRLMLAARSPVFEAKLFGPMAEGKLECIKIDEMKAKVFEALLHFVYTDQLPIDESGDKKTLPVELLQGLSVAADRYALEKLTLLCEEKLAENLSVVTVVTTLLLADRHSCVGLKMKCLEFASDPENLSLVALTEEYLNIMSNFPSLYAELNDNVKSSLRFAKKLRTG